MKTISVREAAAALGISTRAVLYRREKGHLKGVLTKNNGVDEYRIYPNKEIIEGLRKIGSPLLTDSDLLREDDSPGRTDIATKEHPQFETLAAKVRELEEALKKTGVERHEETTQSEADVVEAVSEILDPVETEPRSEQAGSVDYKVSDTPRESANAVAEALWENLICKYEEKIEKKDQEIGQIRAELDEAKQQLKLLPDFEKQKADLLKRIEEERMSAEIQFAKAAEKEQEAEQLTAENERLKQKAEEAALSLEKLQLLEQQMQKLQTPWWKKLFAAPPLNE